MTEMDESLQGNTTETVTYPPEELNLSCETLSVHSKSNPESAMEQEAQDLSQSTLERLVKPDTEIVYEIPPEDKDVDDGQQPLGIVESCFPYLARRSSNQRPNPSQPSRTTFAMCPGVRCYFGTNGYDEDPNYAKGSAEKQPDDIPLKTVG